MSKTDNDKTPKYRPTAARTSLLAKIRSICRASLGAKEYSKSFIRQRGLIAITDLQTASMKGLLQELRENFDFPETAPPSDATKEQVGGNHYKQFELQPAEISQRNKLTFLEGSVVKRMHRHSRGGKGIQDLKKAIHEIRLIAKFDYNEDI